VAATTSTLPARPVHAGKRLPSVEVDSDDLQARHDEGPSRRPRQPECIREILEKWRRPLRKCMVMGGALRARRIGTLTIGSGLGNARFTNWADEND
jgi:hypothetical protein